MTSSPQQSPTRSGAGPSDAALVVSARGGEVWAKEALFRRHARMANGLAFRLMGGDMDVDDLVQDSFVIALESLARLENPQAFASWLGGIVVRRAYKLLRRRRLLARLGLRRDPVDLGWIEAPGAPPDVVSELREIYARIDGLAPKLRIPFVLRRVDALPLDEIARLTGASLATVKRRIRAAEDELGMEGVRDSA